MSADNTVMILETEEGCRVAEVQAADNLYLVNSPFKDDYIEANFGDKQFLDEQEAWKQAEALYKEITSSRFVEYGIQKIKLGPDNEVATPAWFEGESQFNSDEEWDEEYWLEWRL